MKNAIGFDRRGFTLIEVIVVAAIIAILAGILVPMILNQIDESKTTKAKGDCKTIQTAIMTFRKDVGMWPYYSDATKTPATPATFLYTGTNAAPDLVLIPGIDDTSATSISDQLSKNTPKYDATKWKGYLASDVGLDPWGKSYTVNAKDFDANPSVPVWVMSPGPDGVYCASTTVASTEIAAGCDDIGIRIK